MHINGKIITKTSQQNGVQMQQTYIGEIGGVFSRSRRGNAVRMRFTPSGITINTEYSLQWDIKTTLQVDDVGIKVDGRMATVSIRRGIEFTVIRHEANKDKPSFMGFYMNEGSELSQDAQGLIGKFSFMSLT